MWQDEAKGADTWLFADLDDDALERGRDLPDPSSEPSLGAPTYVASPPGSCVTNPVSATGAGFWPPDLEEYAVARERCVRKPSGPAGSEQTRRCVLDALRTVTPTLGCLLLSEIAPLAHQGQAPLMFVIYDWYYRNSQLHMLLIDMVSYRLHDAFALRQDWMHLAVSAGFVARDVRPASDFKGFFICCAQTGTWEPLSTVLTTGVRESRLTESLRKWFEVETPRAGALPRRQSFLEMARVDVVPQNWRPLLPEHAPLLYSPPRLPTLVDDRCTADVCEPCRLAKALPATTSLTELVKLVPNNTHATLQDWVMPTVLSLQSYQPVLGRLRPGDVPTREPAACAPNTSTVSTATSSTNTSTTASTTPSKRKADELVVVHDDEGRRVLCRLCDSPAVCFWLVCCKPEQPVLCEAHGRAARQQSPTGYGKCPEHHRTGPVACLL